MPPIDYHGRGTTGTRVEEAFCSMRAYVVHNENWLEPATGETELFLKELLLEEACWVQALRSNQVFLAEV
jgi:hypothetical protein